jgi:hypothetical protein
MKSLRLTSAVALLHHHGIRDSIIQTTVFRQIMLFRNLDIVVHDVDADGLQGLDNQVTGLPLRSEGDIARDVLLENIRQQNVLLRGQYFVQFGFVVGR